MTFLLDTSVLIDVLRDRKDRRLLLATLVQAGHRLATSAVNIGEVYAGLRYQEQRKAEIFLASLICYPIGQEIGRIAGEQKQSFAEKGQTFGLIDMIVAATALKHSLTLMTDNMKDFINPDLKLYPLS